jgi:uncharacterized membrane protein YphA (DoxX/SURF4 family)
MQESLLAALDAAEASPTRPGVAVWVGRAAAFALGAIFLVAALAKALDPASFAESLTSQGLTLGLGASTVALLVLVLEVGLGLLLILGVRRLWSLALASLVVVTFVVLNGWEWWRSAHGAPPAAGCGCFGNLVQRTPAQAFWQDLAMLLPLLLLAFVGLPKDAPALPRKRMAVVVAGMAAIALFAWRAPDLPLDDLATRVRPGTDLAAVCAGSDPRVCFPEVASEVKKGKSWVVLVDLADAERWSDRLNALAAREGAPPVVAVTGASSDEVRAFTWQWGPTYPLHEAPPALFRPLYRRLPRSFLSEDGRVLRTVSGLPDDGPAPDTSPSGDSKR